MTFYQQAFAALCILPAALRQQDVITGRHVALLLVLGVIFTSLAQSLVVTSLRHLRAQTASVVFSLEPVYGILSAWLLLHEAPAARTLCGGFLICGAVFLVFFSALNARGSAAPKRPRGNRAGRSKTQNGCAL